ncbi:MAG: pilus assembly protein [Dorea sp.]|nr:pilus assembly protein [Dorea sp.]
MKQERITDREFSGMITVEMAYIVPVILFVFFLSVMGIFYYHDKQVIAACAYEAAVTGSTKAREKNGVTAGTVGAVFEERVHGKCILFGEVCGSAQVSDEQIVVKASAAKGKLRAAVMETASVTEPETKIRKYRRLMP